MPLEEWIHVYDSVEGALEDVARNGVPRHAIGIGNMLRAACAALELVREGATLGRKPDPSSPWFPINSMHC